MHVDARTSLGETPLHGAVKDLPITQTARLLLEHGADVDARDMFGMTPFQCTPSYCHDIRQLLSEYGAETAEFELLVKTTMYLQYNSGAL